jgi:hypothetical protein
MGGVVSGIGDFVGDVVGGVGGIASGVAGAIPGIGPYVGPIVGGITGGPVGFATSLGSNALQGNYGGGGGGGSSGSSNVPKYAQPSYNYGNQTYQYGNNPVDASKYFITGDKGVYNLMPALGQISPKTIPSSHGIYNDRFANSVANKSYYTPYEAYTDLSAQMAKDPKALAAFQTAYQPTTPTDKGLSPYVDFGMSGSIGEGSTFADLAKYASTNQNPFYIPYQGVGGKTSAFIPPHVLEAQKKAEAKARFEAMSPEKQQQVIAQRQADMAKFMSKIDPNSNIRNAIAGYMQNRGETTPERQQQIINQREANKANVTPTPVRPTTPAPVRPRDNRSNDNTPRDNRPRDNRPRDNRPTPVAPTTPTPVAPTPVTPPSYPGIISTPFRMAQGGIAMLRRPQ